MAVVAGFPGMVGAGVTAGEGADEAGQAAAGGKDPEWGLRRGFAFQAEVRCHESACGASLSFPELLQLLAVVFVPLAVGFV